MGFFIESNGNESNRNRTIDERFLSHLEKMMYSENPPPLNDLKYEFDQLQRIIKSNGEQCNVLLQWEIDHTLSKGCFVMTVIHPRMFTKTIWERSTSGEVVTSLIEYPDRYQEIEVIRND